MRTYHVYIMASRSRVFYIGVTNDLARRVSEHKQSLIPGFTQKYRVTRLVYYQQFVDIRAAIAREKQLKGWVRARKRELIEARNPTWEDLSFHPSFSFPSDRGHVILSGARERARSEGPAFGAHGTRAQRRTS